MIALLFDLDGTLVDTDHLHHAAFSAILAERGRGLTVDDYRAHIMGQPNGAILDRFFPGEHPAILDRKEALFRDSLAASLEPVPGIHALLDWAEANGAGCAVVTNAPRDNAVAMLAEDRLEGGVVEVVGVDEGAVEVEEERDHASRRSGRAVIAPV